MADYTPTGIIHNTSVDFTRRVISAPVHIVQGDKTLPQIEVELLADGQPYTIPSGASVAIRYGKPDGNAIVNNAASTSGNTATFTVTEQMSALPGEMSPQVMVTVSGGVAATGSFPLIIDRNSVDGATESDSELSTFDKAIQAVATVNESVEKAALSEKNAAASEKAAADSATLAESYAHGGTGTRDGEDADNAYAYMKKAQEAANGTIDGEMSDTSTNTVQNKVIKAYVDGHTPTLNEATDTASGLMSAADKAKLDGIDPIRNLPYGTWNVPRWVKLFTFEGIGARIQQYVILFYTDNDFGDVQYPRLASILGYDSTSPLCLTRDLVNATAVSDELGYVVNSDGKTEVYMLLKNYAVPSVGFFIAYNVTIDCETLVYDEPEGIKYF